MIRLLYRELLLKWIKNKKLMKIWPKISIVTPSYNQGPFIEQTIQSVLSQNYPNLEYVVIDGNSTDESKKIIEKYQKKLTHYESKKDRGQSHAINKGFAKTSGEIMAWLNSDDIYRPGTLHLVASIFANFPEIEWLTCLPATITAEGQQVYLAQPPLYVRSLIRSGMYTRKMLGFVMQEGTFWRRSLWEKSGNKLVEIPYTMDMKLWQEFARHASLHLVEASLAAYRLNPNRKNNDNHQKYYAEMRSHWPSFVAMLIKFFWRQIAKIAHACRLVPKIYFDQKTLEWKFRKNILSVKTLKLLGNT